MDDGRRFSMLTLMAPLVMIVLWPAGSGCTADSPKVDTYFSKDFYSSEESGDMFGYELHIVSASGEPPLKFIEYSGGGDPANVKVLAFEKQSRAIRFTVAQLSFLSPGDTLSFEGSVHGQGIFGIARFTRDTTKTVKNLEFVQADD